MQKQLYDNNVQIYDTYRSKSFNLKLKLKIINNYFEVTMMKVN